MTIDQLRQFIAVAKHLNFSRGADEMFLHQSTVSKNIAAMESELGGPLFIRKKNDLRLTNAGKILYNEAPILVKKFDFVVKRTQNVMSGTFGNLRMALTSGYAHIFSPVYREFSSLYPSIQLDITDWSQENMSTVSESVLDGSHDLALLPLGQLPQEVDDLEKRFFYRDDFVAIVSDSHPLCGKDSVTTAELSGETVLLLSRMKETPLQLISIKLFTSGLSELKLNFVDSHQFPQPSSQLLLQVEAGHGITIVPRQLAMSMGWRKNFMTISDLSVPFDMGIVWRKNNPNPSLPLFTEVLQRHLGVL